MTIETILNSNLPIPEEKIENLLNGKISKDNLINIMKAYTAFNGNAKEASKYLPNKAPTLLKYWRKAGLKTREWHKPDKKKLIKAHKKYEGNVSEATRHLPYSYGTINRYWKEMGLEINGNNITSKDLEKILKTHSQFKGNATEAAKNTGFSYKTILNYWANNDLKPIGNKENTLLKEEKAVNELYNIFNGNAKEAAESYGCSKDTIRRYWNKAGLRTRKHKLSEEEIYEIIKSHKTYKGDAVEAESNLPYHRTTILRTWTNAKLRAAREKLQTEQIKNILKAYVEYDCNATKASEELGHTVQTVKRYWTITIAKIKPYTSVEKLREILNAYKTYDGNASKTSIKLDCSEQKVRKYWNLFGLKTKRRREIDLEKILEIKKLREELNLNTRNVAKKLGISHNTVSRYSKKMGINNKYNYGNANKRRYHPPTIKLNQEQINEIVDAYTKYNGIALDASKHLPYSRNTIITYWRKNNLEIRPKCTEKLDESEIEKIVKAHETSKGILLKAEEILNHSISTIRRYWELNGLKIKYKNKLSDETVQKIIECYEKYNGNARICEKKEGYNHSTILRYWRKNNLEPKQKRESITPKEMKKIIQAHETYEGDVTKAVKELNRAYPTIYYIWKNKGLKINIKKRVSESKKQTIIESYQQFNGKSSKAAEYFGLCYQTIDKYWKNAGLKE